MPWKWDKTLLARLENLKTTWGFAGYTHQLGWASTLWRLPTNSVLTFFVSLFRSTWCPSCMDCSMSFSIPGIRGHNTQRPHGKTKSPAMLARSPPQVAIASPASRQLQFTMMLSALFLSRAATLPNTTVTWTLLLLPMGRYHAQFD